MCEPRRRETLPRSARLRSRRAFARVFQLRIRASDRWMTLYALPDPQAAGRLGISVGRRFGRAVRRNRAKRLVREAFRRVRTELPEGMDWVVVPKPGPEPTVPQLQDSIRKLATRLARQVRSAPQSGGD